MQLFRSLRAWVCVAALAFAGLAPGLAAAEDVVVQRPVTVREGPSRRTEILAYPDVGAALLLLDGGVKDRGYYHVVLPDGRRGWVYGTFVRRTPGEASVASLGALATDRIAVHYLDVDQGAAALLEFPCGAVMIDTGGRGDGAGAHLIAYLDAFFARRPDLNRRLDAVFITHTHVDHNSNLKAVAQRYGIGAYIHNGVLNGSGRSAARWIAGYPATARRAAIPAFAATTSPPIEVRDVAQADVVAAGHEGLTSAQIDPVNCPRVDPRIRVLSGGYEEDENPGWPDSEFDNGNNQSLVIRVDYGEASFLFTGDLEEPAIETLVERYQAGRLLDVDVYLVGHHGSHNGTTLALLRAMSPEVAVVSMGDPSVRQTWTAWAYGHPRRTVVDMLNAAVSGSRRVANVAVADKVKVFSTYRMRKAVYGTGWDGDVTISSGADGVLSVEPGR